MKPKLLAYGSNQRIALLCSVITTMVFSSCQQEDEQSAEENADQTYWSSDGEPYLQYVNFQRISYNHLHRMLEVDNMDELKTIRRQLERAVAIYERHNYHPSGTSLSTHEQLHPVYISFLNRLGFPNSMLSYYHQLEKKQEDQLQFTVRDPCRPQSQQIFLNHQGKIMLGGHVYVTDEDHFKISIVQCDTAHFEGY
ncbi:MAG: hypothetical protein AAFO69_11255 [Bacteroidota bacterium]